MMSYEPRIHIVSGMSCFRYHEKEIKKSILSLNEHIDKLIVFCTKKQTKNKIEKLLKKDQFKKLHFDIEIYFNDIVNLEKIYEFIQNFLNKKNEMLSQDYMIFLYTFFLNYLDLIIIDLICGYLDFWDPEYCYCLLLDSTMYLQSPYQTSSRYKYKMIHSISAFNIQICRIDSTKVWMTYFFKITLSLSSVLAYLQNKHLNQQEKNIINLTHFSLHCQFDLIKSLREEELYYEGFSRFYARKFKSAKYVLERRISLQDNTEEHWHSIYLLGRIYLEEKNWEKAQTFFLLAINNRPSRIEPYYFLIQYFRIKKMFMLANLFLEKAIELDTPRSELIPLEYEKYTYLLFNEIILLFVNNVQHFFLASDTCDKLRLMKDVPRSFRLISLQQQKLYYLHPFPGICKGSIGTSHLCKYENLQLNHYIASAHLLSISSKRWSQLDWVNKINVSSNTNCKRFLLLTCELLNYKREFCVGKQNTKQQNNEISPKDEEQQHFGFQMRCKSEIVVFLIDYHTWKILDEFRIFDHRPTTQLGSPSPHFYCGMQKLKLFIYNNQLWATFHSSDHHLNRFHQIGIAPLWIQQDKNWTIKNVIYLSIPNSYNEEKQWLPFPFSFFSFLKEEEKKKSFVIERNSNNQEKKEEKKQDHLFFIYNSYPFQMIEINPQNGEILNLNKIQYINFEFSFRNSAGPIKWYNNTFLLLIREKLEEKKNLILMHRFLVFTYDFKWIQATRPFYFFSQGYEYVNGCLRYKGGILLSVGGGIGDNKLKFIYISDLKLNELLFNIHLEHVYSAKLQLYT